MGDGDVAEANWSTLNHSRHQSFHFAAENGSISCADIKKHWLSAVPPHPVCFDAW